MTNYDQWRLALPAVECSVLIICNSFETFMYRTLSLLGFIVAAIMAAPAASAQLPPLEILTPQNLHRLQQVGLIQRGTTEELAWSPDAEQLAAVGSAGVRLYTVASGREQLLLGHLGGVNDVDFSPDGRLIASAGDDGILRLWDTATGQLLRALDPYADRPCECVYRLTSAKFAADGRALWVGAQNGPLRVIDVDAGTILAEDPRNVLEIVPDADRAQFIVTEQHSSHVTVWSSTGQFVPLHDLDVRFTVWNASFASGTSRLLIAGFVGVQMALVDVDTGETIDMVRGSRVLHVGVDDAVATQVIDWIGDYRRISLQISDIDSGVVQFSTSLAVELTDARFSPAGDRLAYSETDGALHIVDWRRNIRLLDTPPRGTALIGLALLDGNLVASIDGGVGVVQSLTRVDVPTGRAIRFWDLVSGRERGAIQTWEYGLISADVLYWDSSIERLIVGSTSRDDLQLEIEPMSGDVRVVRTYDIRQIAAEQSYSDHPSGLIQAAVTTANDIRVVESLNDQNGMTLQAAGPAVRFSADGTLLLTAGPSGAVRVWGVPAVVPAPN